MLLKPLGPSDQMPERRPNSIEPPANNRIAIAGDTLPVPGLMMVRCAQDPCGLKPRIFGFRRCCWSGRSRWCRPGSRACRCGFD
jgi:hypothetical protein